MLNSIFKKGLLTFIVLAVTIIFMISLVIGIWSRQNTLQGYEGNLFKEAFQVRDLLIRKNNGQLSENELQQSIRSIEERSDAIIDIISRKEGLNTLERNHPNINASWVKKVLYDNRNIAESFIQQEDQRQMVIVGIPGDVTQKNQAAIFLYSPYQNIEGMVQKINRIIILTSSIVGLIVMILFYFASRRFTEPIIRMSRIANQMAQGNFAEKMTLRGNDEISVLASAFNRMAEQLGRVEQTRKAFISEIAHELRTPLTTVHVSLHGLLEDIYDQKEEKEIIQISLQETKRLSKLVEDLLELTAFEERQVKLFKKEVDLESLLQQTVTQMNLKAKAKGVNIQTEIDLSDAALLTADPDRLKQVFINLMDNAIFFSPEGEKIDFILKRENGIIITIQDYGVGIETEKLPHIFQRFYKADESRSKQGAGLGLTISKYIVEAHGGHISVHSDLGKGTRFTIYFPE